MPHQGRCEWRRTTTLAPRNAKAGGLEAQSYEMVKWTTHARIRSRAPMSRWGSAFTKTARRTITRPSRCAQPNSRPNPDHDRSDDGPDSEVDFMCACPAASTTTPVKGKARGAHDDEKGPDDEGNAHEGSGKNAKRSKAKRPKTTERSPKAAASSSAACVAKLPKSLKRNFIKLAAQRNKDFIWPRRRSRAHC